LPLASNYLIHLAILLLIPITAASATKNPRYELIKMSRIKINRDALGIMEWSVARAR